MKIHCKYDELIDPKDLKNHPQNRNKHGKDQIERLAKLYEYQGVRHPIIVSKQSGFIVAGHGRKLAAIRAGIKEFPVVYQSFESNEQEYAFIQSDNAIALWAELEIKDIKEDVKMFSDDFNIDWLGIEDFKINSEPKPEDDDVPLDVPAKVKLGEVYRLGSHRLMCGDSTLSVDVKRLFDGSIPNIMMTDPPYGVELDQSWREDALKEKALGKVNKRVVRNDDRADWADVWRLFPGNVAYVWHASKFSDVVMKSLRDADLEPNQQLIWNKSVMVMGRCDYHFKHEPCWYSIRRGKNHDWTGDRSQTTIIEAASPKHIMSGSNEEKTDHPTQKPVACMGLIANHSGDVYDPFGGSGSTLIACEKTNRKCFMMELDPHYCDVIIKRWENYTNQKAELIDG